MMRWEKALLGNLITIKHGWAFKGQFFTSEGQYIVVTPGNFIEEGGFRTREGKEKYYTGDYPKEYLLEKDDLIIAMTEQGPGLLGSPGLIPEPNKFLHNQRIGLLNIFASDSLDKKFLYYLFFTDTVRNKIFGSATGTKVKHTAPKRIYNIEVYLPPSPTQRRIASILSAYDDLIENNLRRIKLLEELAQRTYEEWFVKFTINGEKLPLNEETGLPEGWNKSKFENCVINFDNKRKPLAKMVREERKGIFPYYGAAGIIDYIDSFIFDGRYLLIGEDGTVITPKGVAMLQFIEGKFWVSNHAHVIIGRDNVSTEYVYCFLSQYPISQHITGAAQPKISQMNLNRIELIIGSENVMKEFDCFILPLFNQIFNLKKQNLLLKESRNILLPRLMSGKINVEEAEEQMAMAAEPLEKYEKQ